MAEIKIEVTQIDQAKAAKAKLEKDITDQLRTYELTYGLAVTDVKLKVTSCFDGTSQVSHVDLKVEL